MSRHLPSDNYLICLNSYHWSLSKEDLLREKRDTELRLKIKEGARRNKSEEITSLWDEYVRTVGDGNLSLEAADAADNPALGMSIMDRIWDREKIHFDRCVKVLKLCA